MPDLQWELALDKEFGEIYDQASHYATQLAEQILIGILETGPYWSGRSYASWVVSLDEAIIQEAVDVERKAGALSVEEARQRALDTLSSLEIFRLGQTIFISQGTVYLKLIEEGFHGKANVGFIAAVLSHYEGLINLSVTY